MAIVFFLVLRWLFLSYDKAELLSDIAKVAVGFLGGIGTCGAYFAPKQAKNPKPDKGD